MFAHTLNNKYVRISAYIMCGFGRKKEKEKEKDLFSSYQW